MKGSDELIYTSRYANKELTKDEYYAVAISLGLPKWPLKYKINSQCVMVAPKGYMLKMEKAPYRDAYMRKLAEEGSAKVIDTIRKFELDAAEQNKSLVLLCFEDLTKPGQWCHRTMFSEWWEDKTGQKIEELACFAPPKKQEPVKEEPVEQYSLF